MRRHASGWVTCLIALTLAGAAAAAPVTRTTLANGLTVLAVQNDSVVVAGAGLLVRVSALDEATYGIGSRAILQQAILTIGHQELTGLEEVASATISRRSNFTVHTDHDTAEASMGVVIEELEPGLARLRSYMFAPPLTEETFESARELVHQGFDSTHRSPVQATYDLFRAAYYGSGPLAGPLDGDHEDFDAVTLERMQALHAERYTAANSILCVVAPLPVADIAAAVERVFGDMPASEPSAPTPAPALPAEALVEVSGASDLGQSSVVVGVPMADPAAEDYVVGELIAQLLDGPGGRLRRDHALLQSLGLAIPSRLLETHYPIRPLPIPLTRQPYLAVHALCAPSNIERTRAGLLRQLLALRTGSVADAELVLARKRLININALSYLDPSSAAVHLAQREALGMPVETDTEYATRVAAITAEDLTAYALKHFTRHAVGLQMPEM